MTVSMVFLFRQIQIFLCLKKWLYSPHLLHLDVILWPISLLISLPDVTNLPKYLYSVISSNCSASIITPVLSVLLATSLNQILVFFFFFQLHSISLTFIVHIFQQHIFQFLFTFSKQYYVIDLSLIWLSRHWVWLCRGYWCYRSLMDWLIDLQI